MWNLECFKIKIMIIGATGQLPKMLAGSLPCLDRLAIYNSPLGGSLPLFQIQTPGLNWHACMNYGSAVYEPLLGLKINITHLYGLDLSLWNLNISG